MAGNVREKIRESILTFIANNLDDVAYHLTLFFIVVACFVWIIAWLLIFGII